MDTNKKILCTLYPLDKDLTRTWFISFSVNGGPAKKKYGDLNKLSTLEEREKEAEKLVQLIEKEYDSKTGAAEGVAADGDSPGLLGKRELIQAFENAFEDRKEYLREGSIKIYNTKVQSFLTWYRGSDFTEFSEDALKAYLKDLKKQVSKQRGTTIANTTRNFYASTLKTLFKDMITNKVIIENPLQNYRKLPEFRKSYKHFDESLQSILAQAIPEYNPQLWLVCQMSCYCLIRPGEIRKLKVGDINLKNASIQVPNLVSKNKKTMHVRIPDCFIDQLRFIEKYPADYYLFSTEGHPSPYKVGQTYFLRLHREVLEALKLDRKKYVLYSWKHTGAVMYYMATKDLKGLKEQGRWHSLDMVEEYLKNLGVFDIESIKKDFPEIKKGAAQAVA